MNYDCIIKIAKIIIILIVIIGFCIFICDLLGLFSKSKKYGNICPKGRILRIAQVGDALQYFCYPDGV